MLSGVQQRVTKRKECGNKSERPRKTIVSHHNSVSGGLQRQFACPFIVRYPRTSDCRQGYPYIHRLKEHLRRRHMPTISSVTCPRCFAEFEEATERWNHLRSITPCELTREQPLGDKLYISKETSDALNRRTKKHEDPEDSWRHIYVMLFPDAARKSMPSPYLDSIPKAQAPDHVKEMSSSSPNENIAPSMRQLIKKMIEATHDVDPQTIKQLLQDLVTQLARIAEDNDAEDDDRTITCQVSSCDSSERNFEADSAPSDNMLWGYTDVGLSRSVAAFENLSSIAYTEASYTSTYQGWCKDADFWVYPSHDWNLENQYYFTPNVQQDVRSLDNMVDFRGLGTFDDTYPPSRGFTPTSTSYASGAGEECHASDFPWNAGALCLESNLRSDRESGYVSETEGTEKSVNFEALLELPPSE